MLTATIGGWQKPMSRLERRQLYLLLLRNVRYSSITFAHMHVLFAIHEAP